MGAIFGGGTREKSSDGGASAYAQAAAASAQEQARQAQANNEALRKQLDDQQKADAQQKAQALSEQQAALSKQNAEQAAKDSALAQQNAAQNVTGGAGVDFNKLNQGALALNQSQGLNSASDKLSNLQRLQNQKIYGAQSGFNSDQKGGQRFYS